MAISCRSFCLAMMGGLVEDGTRAADLVPAAAGALDYPIELPAEMRASLAVDTRKKVRFNPMLLGLNCSWPAKQYRYFQLNAEHPMIEYDPRTHTHRRTALAGAYDVIRGVFEGSEMLESRVDSTKIGNGLDTVSAEAVVKEGKITVFAINKTNRGVPLDLTVDGTPPPRQAPGVGIRTAERTHELCP